MSFSIVITYYVQVAIVSLSIDEHDDDDNYDGGGGGGCGGEGR